MTEEKKELGIYKKKSNNTAGIYSNMLITRKVPVSINNVGFGIKETLEKIISSTIEGKCIVEGFIKPNSTKILTNSSGIIKGNGINFEVVFECDVCSPVEGMHINCIAKNITKAGIRAETIDDPSPVVIFISRDHHYTSPYFASIKPEQEIKVRVIGQRFELNDKYISVIAELIEAKENKFKHKKRKPILKIKDKIITN
tara:strand:- start:1313 stop:1909 length:597 start_codon:yes stop_codon:yes gene_type:complete